MMNPFNARALSFDAAAINETIQKALASAGLDTTTGPMHGVTETIRRALAEGAVAEAAQFDRATVLDGAAHTVAAADDAAARSDRDTSISEAQRSSSYETHDFSNRAGSRAY